MIVVSNTSPLTNLAAIGQFSLLQQLYAHVHIADGVWHELNAHGREWPGSAEVQAANWMERKPVQNAHLVTALHRDLDRGEAETIALAIELGADLVLLDETDGRRLAKRHGLKVIGVLGILLDAKSSGYIDRVMVHVEALRSTAGFYVGEQVERTVRRLAAEEEARVPQWS